jgi:hypothetical protein
MRKVWASLCCSRSGVARREVAAISIVLASSAHEMPVPYRQVDRVKSSEDIMSNPINTAD